MIRLEQYPHAVYHPDFVSSHRHEIPSEFFSSNAENEESCILLSDREPIGFCSRWLQDSRAHFRFWFTADCSFEDQADAIALWCEKTVKQSHPARLLCTAAESMPGL